MGKISVPIDDTLRRLLAQEDTDNDRQITVLDHGPKQFDLQTTDGTSLAVFGTYYLSNLLQELALQKAAGKRIAKLDYRRIFENPVGRLSRMIKTQFWDGLTRRIDEHGLANILGDEKAGEHGKPRIYVPFDDDRALEYYQQIARTGKIPGLEVIRLPQQITPEYVRSINRKPGILALALESVNGHIRGVPFVVPGGRFNEMYGWDSYFEALGLLEDGRVDLAKAMVDNFCYQIVHYGQILNANRTYYLTRSQPPFLTSMARSVFAHLPENAERRNWLAGVVRIAIQEYETVWTNAERRTPTGLSRYYAYGLGIPPETEAGHYDAVLRDHAAAAGMDVRTFAKQMIAGEIEVPALNEYFLHDRAVRESGHDTSYRIENRCANLNTVDLNALLYKYETDIAEIIETDFGDALPMPGGRIARSDIWKKRAVERRRRVNDLLWDAGKGMYFDYDFVRKKKTFFESATAFYPLWAKIASAEQAALLVEKALPVLEAPGGIVSTSLQSRGEISEWRPAKQWDYPNGWAPHQMLIWQGLLNYGYTSEAQRLAYRWLDMITRNAADFNGTVPEKYDVIRRSHQVFMEYGNVGTQFDYITREGFGWMNASYKVGLGILNAGQLRNLKQQIPAEWLFGASNLG